MSESELSSRILDFDDYAEPTQLFEYDAFKQGYQVPEWKNTSGKNKKKPVADFGTACVTDKEIYFTPEIKELEEQKLWPKVWILAGHLNDIPEENRYMTIDVGHESFIINRGAGDSVRAFYNFCQHKGALLLKQAFGQAMKYVCPFHSWQYSPNGDAIVSDRETFRQGALCHDLNLTPVRAEVFRGWVFINMDENAMPLDKFLGPDVKESMEAYDLENMVRVRDIIQEWPFNWKTAHEAFVEGYHVQATHPQLWPVVDAYHTQYDIYNNGHSRAIYQFMSPLAKAIGGMKADRLTDEHKLYLREAGLKEDDFPKHWRDVPKAVIDAKQKKLKKDCGIDYSKFTEGQLTDNWGIGIFPTHEFFLDPEGILLQEWFPHQSDPEKCIYRARVYAIEGTSELPGFMAAENIQVDAKNIIQPTYADPDDETAAGPVITQDRFVLGRVQRGMHSRGFKGSVLSEQEIRIRAHLDEYYKYMREEKTQEG